MIDEYYAVIFAKGINRKKHAMSQTNDLNLRKLYCESIKKDIADLEYYCEHNKISINDVWAKVKQGD